VLAPGGASLFEDCAAYHTYTFAMANRPKDGSRLPRLGSVPVITCRRPTGHVAVADTTLTICRRVARNMRTSFIEIQPTYAAQQSYGLGIWRNAQDGPGLPHHHSIPVLIRRCGVRYVAVAEPTFAVRRYIAGKVRAADC